MKRDFKNANNLQSCFYNQNGSHIFHSELERTEGKEIVYGSQFEPYKN